MDTGHTITIIRNNRGFALVYVAIAIVALVGVLGLAIDLGHMYVVRGELQNAADASALAGAASLYKDPLSPGAAPALNFARAHTAATKFINENKSDGVSLTNGTIATGYWNLTNKSLGSPANPTPQDVPAVTALISRSAGNNAGPVPTFFARVFGTNEAPVSSRLAVAVSGFPGSADPNLVFPMALSRCFTDYVLSRPKAQWPNPVFTNSPYGPAGANCETGQWTSLKLDRNDPPTLFDLMKNGNPETLAAGESIWIEPGVEGTVFHTNKWPSFPAGGIDVLVPIVDDTNINLSTKGERTITGFATFHISGTCGPGTGGGDCPPSSSIVCSSKCVYGYFVETHESYPGTRPGGSISNIVTPPLMVQ